MFKSMDIKSVLIGGLLVLVVLTSFGGVPWLQEETFGRFAVGATDQGAFILDTATGQAWAYVMSDKFGTTVVPNYEEFFAPKLDVNEPRVVLH